MNLRKAAKMALTALDTACPNLWFSVRENLRQSLKQAELVWLTTGCNHNCLQGRACVCAEVQEVERTWVGLTEEEFSDLLYFDGRLDRVEVPLIADLIRAVQAKLKEKNHAD